ncbi:colicin uptake protein TolR [secondary endosymbiont of Ctenarytaina eucalypti]|uniref:Biopolymer transport protein n=1 Tax=secondary endosymbiont of Ctenarytaina eucalypti TaxID=1199245 RepID=J3Z424_9ENTR|nr:colicin uptake protein TolR [secondary endosymbiont of Ctenarytaina eucalypti]AFP85019.1 biopolymer transport protein [secondary endosymbiont of Ctenarytaina eucalypti]
MSRKRFHGTIKSEINIVPLLDVLLVLVLIFMATAPVITQSVEVNLPDSTDSRIVGQDENPTIIVEVTGIGQYNLMVDQRRQENLSSEKIFSEVQAHITTNTKTVFLIGGAKEVPYDGIIKALNLLHRAGAHSVGLMTRPI